MFNKKSYYALNKSDRDAIVYTDASNNTIRLTRDDFDTEADFLKWKQWSDENYHEEEKRDHRQADHSVASTDLLEVVCRFLNDALHNSKKKKVPAWVNAS